MQGTRTITRSPKRRLAGMTLIELLVALAIGAFLMLGAITVFMQGRTTFRINESVARLQENARFVLDALEPDIRMASYFGLTAHAGLIDNTAPQTDPHAGLGPSTCGNNWVIDLAAAIEGTNNAYGWTCAANGGFQAATDTLVVRRVAATAVEVADLVANRMYIVTGRQQPGQIFTGTAVPAGYDAALQDIHELVTNGYYVSQTSSVSMPGNAVPSLRVKTLGAGPAITDQEVLPGVEDMQIQFGVDTDLEGSPERGAIDRYVNADDPILDPADAAFIEDAEILAVRIWLRIRAERPENGFEDTTNYVYADEDFTANDQFRRAVVSKTIYLRNMRPES